MSDLQNAIINWNELSDPMLKAMMLKRSSLPQNDDTGFIDVCHSKFENLTIDQQMIIVKEIFSNCENVTKKELNQALN